MFCLKNVLQAASLNQYLQQRQCHARFHSKNKEPNKPCDKRFGESCQHGKLRQSTAMRWAPCSHFSLIKGSTPPQACKRISHSGGARPVFAS